MCVIDWELVFKFCTLAITFITIIIGLRKFQYEKNRDYFLRRLNEVYAPLFSIIIKQETYRNVYMDVNPIIKNPALLFSESIDGTVYTSFEDFEKVIDSINKGLARPILLIRINQYKQIRELMLYYGRQTKESNLNKKIPDNIRIELNRLSIDLRNEIIDGYKECIKKLNLKNNTKELDSFYYKHK
jgi:hypothetical protein